jgi:putative intracellular protease/amidase
MKRKTKYVTALLALIALAFSQTNAGAQHKKQGKAKKVLLVVTSFGQLKNGTMTGIWLEEFTTPYYLLKEKGIELTIASPAGGKAPIDPRSTTEQMLTPSARKFLGDAAAQQALNNTVVLSMVNAKDYDAVFYPGGHGPMWDLPENARSVLLIEAFVAQGKVITFVCHAPAVLKNVKTKNGDYLLKGKTVTGFSNSEEMEGQSTNMVPYSLEDMLKERGANYEKGAANWGPFAVQDGLLITGQNPASAEITTRKLIASLYAK